MPVLSELGVIAITTALMHAVLLGYVLVKRVLPRTLPTLFAAYLLMAALWDVGILVDNLPAINFPLAYLYPLLPMTVLLWLYTVRFLPAPGKQWKMFALAGGTLAVMALIQFLPYRMPYLPIPFSGGRYFDRFTIVFWLAVAVAGFVMGHALWLTDHLQATLHSPRHQNRARLLNIALVTALIGLAMGLIPITAEVGLVVHWLAALELTYLSFNRYLPDIKYSAKEVLGWLAVTILTATVFFAVILLSHQWAWTSPVMWAALSSIVLAVLYPVVQATLGGSIRRILFANQYNSANIIKSYVHAINSLLLLQDLVSVSLTFIAANLKIERGAFFLLENDTGDTMTFAIHSNLNGDLPPFIQLKKDTAITRTLVDEKLPLAQFALDLDARYAGCDPQAIQEMRGMGFEQYFPVHRNAAIVGILALGPFSDGRDYTLQDIELLSTIAEQTAIALENARLFEDIRHNLHEITRINSMMDNVFASIQSGVVTVDVQDRIIVINDAAYHIFNLPDDITIGTPVDRLFKHLPQTPLPALLRDVKTTFRNYKGYEITQEVPGRGAVNLSVDLSPIRNAQRATIGVAMVLNDLTENRKLQAVQNLFRKYLSPAVVDRLPNDPAELKLGGQRQDVTILFADIRGFSTFSEHKDPEDLITVLNKYLSLAAEAILAYEGTLDKFVGDAVMAIFNAPLPQPDHTLRAVRAALEMQRAIDKYHDMMAEYAPQLSFGVGIHVGEAVIGNVGTQSRMDYTAIGDAVNLAKRLQENTPGGRILLSAAAYERVKDSVNAVPYRELVVKGRETPEQTYELLGIR